MWILIILLLVVLYYIGKHDKEKKNKESQPQAQPKAQAKAQEKARAKAAAAQQKRNRQYDAETKQLYKTIISDYKKFINLSLHGKTLKAGRLIKDWKKLARENIQIVKQMQKIDSDGTRIRQFYNTRHRQFMKNVEAIVEVLSDRPSASSSFSGYSAPIYSPPTYSSSDYYAQQREQEERQKRQSYEAEVFRRQQQIDDLRRCGSVIEADEMKKDLDDFKRRGF